MLTNGLDATNNDLKMVLTLHGLTLLGLSQPTRVTKSTESLIDIILTNQTRSIVQAAIIPTSIGDHAI